MKNIILMKLLGTALLTTKRRFHFSVQKKELEISPLPFTDQGLRLGLVAADPSPEDTLQEESSTGIQPISRTFRSMQDHSADRILQNSPDIICTVDRKGRFVTVNNAIQHILGFRPDEIEGTLFTDFIVTADADITLRAACRVFSGAAKTNFENHCNHKDGGTVTMQWSLSWSAEDNLIYCVGRDVTELRTDTAVLSENAQRYSSLFEYNPEAVFSLDLDGNFTSANAKTAEKTGCTAEALIGRSFVPFIVPEYLELTMENFEKARRGEKTDYDIAIVDINGKQSHINVVNMPIIINGVQTGIYGIAKDISDRKQYEQELKSLNESLEQKIAMRTAELEQAIKEMEAFSYSVSHDLRAPLRIINGYTKLLHNEYMDQFDADGKEFMDAIIENTKYMGRLIDDLLNLSRLGREAINTTQVDMTALAHVVLHEMRMEDSSLMADIKIHDLKPCIGDQLLIRQVWNNLLSNAVKYSKKKEYPQIEIGSYEKGNSTVYYVKDNGAGFDMRFAAKLFGVFIRLHDRSEFDGTGVGLALVHRIVTKHGGKVWANGKVNEGAVFYFSLPNT